MTTLRVSPSGQVYDIDLKELKVTPDEGGGYYLHGRGQFIRFEELETALDKKRELDLSFGVYGGR